MTTNPAKYCYGFIRVGSKDAALQKFREILQKKPFRAELTSKEQEAIQELLKQHPSYEEYSCRGVVKIVRARFPGDIYNHFEVVLKDGSQEAFSLKTCFLSKEAKLKSLVEEAFRYAVLDQIKEFKAQQRSAEGLWVSALSGKTLTSCHVDHSIPFWRLVEDFRREHNLLDYHSIELGEELASLGYRISVLTEPVLSRWRDYHLKNAKLRILSESENLSDMNAQALAAKKYKKNWDGKQAS